jgi:hypothetical protein
MLSSLVLEVTRLPGQGIRKISGFRTLLQMEGLYHSVVFRDQADNVGRRDLTGDRGALELILHIYAKLPE